MKRGRKAATAVAGRGRGKGAAACGSPGSGPGSGTTGCDHGPAASICAVPTLVRFLFLPRTFLPRKAVGGLTSGAVKG